MNIANNVYVSDCLSFMQGMDSNSVDMVLTSPPYDNLRKYDGYSFDFFPIAKELYRIMKDGATDTVQIEPYRSLVRNCMVYLWP